MSELKLYVWEKVLYDYTEGIVVVYAHSEAEAWDILEKKKYNVWWELRYGYESETTYDYDAPGMPVEELKPMRPRVITEPEAFVVRGGS